MPDFALRLRTNVEGLAAKAVYGLVSLTAAALVWAQFRGFDMLDGAYYFLLYQDPQDNPDTTTRFHLMARPLWLLCSQNIVVFRFATIAVATMASCFFWRCWLRILGSKRNSGLYGCTLWLAMMAGLTWVPVALTYNSLANIFSLLALGALFWALAPSANGREALVRAIPAAFVFLLGMLGLLLAKPPAFGAVGAAAYLILCFDRSVPRWARLSLLFAGGLVLLGAAGVGVYVLSRPDFSVYNYFYVAGAPFNVAMLRGLGLRYLRELWTIAPYSSIDFAWVIVPVIWALTTLRRRNPTSLALFLLAALVALGARRLWDGSFSSAVAGNAYRFYLLLWCALLPICIFSLLESTSGERPNRLRSVSRVLALAVVPLVSSIGTTNTVYVATLHETILWAAGLLIVAQLLSAEYSAPWFATGVALLISLASVGAIYSGHFARPYMFQPSLWKQTEVADIGVPVTRLKVDPALASFLLNVREALTSQGYKPGDDVFGFFNLPGVIFAIGAREPGAPWYFGTWYSGNEADGAKLRGVPLSRRQSAWIVTQDDLTKFKSQFHYFNIDFPDGYVNIGHAINPVSGLEVRIWKPRGRP
jgi:hypothetical protein